MTPEQDLCTILSTEANHRGKKTESTPGTCNLLPIDSADSPASFTEPVDQIIDSPISLFETHAANLCIWTSNPPSLVFSSSPCGYRITSCVYRFYTTRWSDNRFSRRFFSDISGKLLLRVGVLGNEFCPLPYIWSLKNGLHLFPCVPFFLFLPSGTFRCRLPHPSG